MKEIPLTQGKVALVDDDDFERVNQFKWRAKKVQSKSTVIWYAQRSAGSAKNRVSIFMHSFILGVKMVDHRNRNGLDNTRKNIRECTQSQNLANRVKINKFTSKYKGVRKSKGKFEANIQYQGKCIYIGRFVNEIEAAIAYDIKAYIMFKEFAVLNFPIISTINIHLKNMAWQAWEELRRQIEEQEYEGVPKYDEYKEKELFELWFNKQIS